MGISVVRLQNLRNYTETEFKPAPRTTVVAGPNASGKSTLLECIGLFATLSSPRAGNLGVLVRREEQEAGARLETDAGTALEIRLRGGRALLRVGGSGAVARTFLGWFRAVLFTPEDLDLVRGGPEGRRRALDDLIVQLRPVYRGVRQDYERALRQRNAALKRGSGEEAAVYDAVLASAGAQVLEARRSAVSDLGPRASELYSRMAARGTLELRYKDTSGAGELAGDELERFLLQAYEEDLPLELERGFTRRGAHRDDLEIEVDGVEARAFASRGEQRSAALAFRMSELTLLEGAVLLLDDVLSELDADRRLRLFETIGERQTIVTTTDPAAMPAVDARWSVESGVLRECAEGGRA